MFIARNCADVGKLNCVVSSYEMCEVILSNNIGDRCYCDIDCVDCCPDAGGIIINYLCWTIIIILMHHNYR